MVVSCSKQERKEMATREWSDIQATDEIAAVVPSAPREKPAKAASPKEATPDEDLTMETKQTVPTEDLSGFIKRLEEMKTIKRQPGQTLLMGKSLVFDYDQRFVRMDGDVVVLDDHGELDTESLIGRFSVSNEVESIEATGGVSIVSENRKAKSESAHYNYLTGVVQLDGLATVSENGNRLSGERIQFWIKDNRKMICEPNALLEITSSSVPAIKDMPAGEGVTEVRANQVVYDESASMVELDGHVRLRDSRLAMNSEKVRISLKDDNKIDWIKASGGVIIQSQDRKALADRATYEGDEDKFTLEGSPKVMQGQNVMTGDRITFWQKTRRMVCEPNARVLLYLDEETKAKFLKDLND